MKGWFKKESLAYLWGASAGWRRSILLDSLVGIASVLLSLAFIYLSKLAIDVATGAVAGIRLWQAGAGLLVLLLLQLGCNVCEGWIGVRMQVGAGNGLRHRLFAHLLYSRWNEQERFHTGDVVNRIERDVSAVVSLLTVSVPSLLIVSVQLLAAFAFFCLLDPWLPWAVMAVLPLFLPVARFYMRRMNRYTHAIRQSDSHIQSLIQESLQHRLVVKALEQNRRHVGRLDERQREWSGQVMQRTRFSLASRLLVSLAFSGGYLIAFLWGTVQLGEGLITFGTMAAFLQLVGKIQQPVLGLARLLPAFAEAFTAADRLLELEHVSVEDAAEPLRFREPPAVEIRDLTFRYSPGDRVVFTRFSCDFPAGSCTAVVGETGKGKRPSCACCWRWSLPSRARPVCAWGSASVPCRPKPAATSPMCRRATPCSAAPCATTCGWAIRKPRTKTCAEPCGQPWPILSLPCPAASMQAWASKGEG